MRWGWWLAVALLVGWAWVMLATWPKPATPRMIVGRVSDPSGKPLADVAIVVQPDSASARSGGDGVFVIPDAARRARALWVLKRDYRPRWIRLDDYTPGDSLRIELTPVAVAAPPPDSALAGRAAEALLAVEDVRVYRLNDRFMGPLPAGRDVPGVGFVGSELEPPDSEGRRQLARLMRRIGAPGCGTAPNSGEVSSAVATREAVRQITSGTWAIAVMDSPAPLVLELSMDFSQCVLRRDGRAIMHGAYATDCVADSLRLLIGGLAQPVEAKR